MKKLSTILILSLAVQLCFGQNNSNRLAGKTYEALVSVEIVCSEVVYDIIEECETDSSKVADESIPYAQVRDGSSYFYIVLTFEKDSVLISDSAILFNGEKEFFELGKFFYTKKNQTVKIKNFKTAGETFILTIKDGGQTLLVNEKGNPFYWKTVSFRLKENNKSK
jgi:hypothetical protein